MDWIGLDWTGRYGDVLLSFYSHTPSCNTLLLLFASHFSFSPLSLFIGAADLYIYHHVTVIVVVIVATFALIASLEFVFGITIFDWAVGVLYRVAFLGESVYMLTLWMHTRSINQVTGKIKHKECIYLP